MRLSPSVISLIESHLAVPGVRQSRAVKTSLKAIAPTLHPASSRLAIPANGSTTSKLSFKAALRKYPRNPSVALAVAHRLLNHHASEPSTSSRVSYLLRRQRIYERIIRTFTSHPSVEWVTVASVFQRMMDECTPPSLDSLKIVLSVAGRTGMPVLPILRQVVEMDGLPEKMDSHLLVLVMKGLVKEGGINTDSLRNLVEELRAGGLTDEGALDEIVVEAYGQEGDLRGILNIISHHRSTHPPSTTSTKRSATLSLYLQTLKQWTANPALRRKRRGSLFPRILAKDLVEIYGGAEKLPLIWLNAWMNGERISGETKTALTIWRLIGTSADDYSYATYFKLAKLLSIEEADLRRTVRSYLASGSKMTVESVESGLSASFHHGDLPLALLLARRLLDTPQRNASVLRPTERTIDLIASGIVRSQRSLPRDGLPSTPTSPRLQLPEFITRNEWDGITHHLGLDGVTLPLSRPQARLSIGTREKEAKEDTLVKTYLPDRGSQSAFLQIILARLVVLLEETIVYQNRAGAGQDSTEVLKAVMSKLHSQVLLRP